jgi:hypothetical protein
MLRQGAASVVLAAAVALFGALMFSTTSEASVLEREHDSGTFTIDETICDHDFHIEGAYRELFFQKLRGAEPVPVFQDKFFSHEVLLDAEGNGLILDRNSLSKDVRLTRLSGGLYRFTDIAAGQVETWRTLSGRVVQRNVGLLKVSFLVDTQDDADPSNDEILEQTLLKDAGKHPAFYSSDEEFCAMVEEAMAG